MMRSQVKLFAEGSAGSISYTDCGGSKYRVRLRLTDEPTPRQRDALAARRWFRRRPKQCLSKTVFDGQALHDALAEAVEAISHGGVRYNHSVPRALREYMPSTLGDVLAEALHRKRVEELRRLGVRGANIRWRPETTRQRLEKVTQH